jgi:uncharacterized Tic20 family protein
MSQYGQDPTYQSPTPYRSPGQVSGLSAEDRNLGTIAHVTPLVLMIVSGGLAGFIGSLVVYLYAKDRGAAARQYAAGALNVQIIVCIAAAISYVLMFVLVGFLTLPLVILFGLVVHVVGALKANKGEAFTPPFTPSFVS